jgi:hypothetical protein
MTMDQMEIIATYEAESDGQTVNVYEERWPGNFYTIEVLPGHNSIGFPQPGYRLNTGSGMKKLALDVAKAISKDMLGLALSNKQASAEFEHFTNRVLHHAGRLKD